MAAPPLAANPPWEFPRRPADVAIVAPMAAADRGDPPPLRPMKVVIDVGIAAEVRRAVLLEEFMIGIVLLELEQFVFGIAAVGELRRQRLRVPPVRGRGEEA